MAIDLVARFIVKGKDQATRSAKQFKTTLEGVAKSAKTAGDSVRRSFSSQGKTLSSASSSYARLSQSSKKLGLDTKALSSAFNKLRFAVNVGGSVDKVNARFRVFQAEARKSATAIRNFGTAVTKTKGKSKDFITTLDGMARSVRIIEGPLGGTAARLQTLVALLRTGRGAMLLFSIGITAVVVGLGLLGKAIFSVRLEFERIERALAFAEGGFGKARETMAFLKKTALELGLDLKGTAKQFSLLAAATAGTIFEGKLARDLFMAVAQASAALGLSTDDTSGIFRAFQQMISKGTIQAEELRGQLGERLPGAFRLFAESAGLSTAALGKLLKDGKGITEEMLPDMIKLMLKTFGPASIAGAKGLNAAVNRLASSWSLLLDKMDQVIPVSRTMTKIFNELSRQLQDITDIVNKPKVPFTIADFTAEIALAERLAEQARDKLREATTTPVKFAIGNKAFGIEIESKALSESAFGKFFKSGAIEVAQIAVDKLEKSVNKLTEARGKLLKAQKLADLIEGENLGKRGNRSKIEAAINDKLADSAADLFETNVKGLKQQDELTEAKEIFAKISEREEFVTSVLGLTHAEYNRRVKETLVTMQEAIDKKTGLTKALDKEAIAQERANKFVSRFQGRINVLGARAQPSARDKFIKGGVTGEEARINSLSAAVRAKLPDMTKMLDDFRKAKGDAFDFKEVTKLMEAFKTPQEKFADRMMRLNSLMAAFPANADAIGNAMKQARQELINTDPVLKSLSDGFDSLASGIVSSMKSGENAIESFRNVALKVVDDLLEAFIQLSFIDPLKKSFGLGGSGGGLGGIFSLLSGGSTPDIGALFGNTGFSPSFASGGSFKVGGTGGTDTKPVSFNASPGEEVTILNKRQQREQGKGSRGGDTFIIDARGADAGQIRRLEAMIRQMDGTIEKRAFAAAVDGEARRLNTGAE